MSSHGRHVTKAFHCNSGVAGSLLSLLVLFLLQQVTTALGRASRNRLHDLEVQ